MNRPPSQTKESVPRATSAAVSTDVIRDCAERPSDPRRSLSNVSSSDAGGRSPAEVSVTAEMPLPRNGDCS